jgi:hypothetical protein
MRLALRFVLDSSSQGLGRFACFQDVARTKWMTELGVKLPIVLSLDTRGHHQVERGLAGRDRSGRWPG